MPVQELELRDVKKVIETIREHYPYDFSNYAKASLRRRIMHVIDVHRLSDVDELNRRLREEESFFKRVIEDISVNTTEMFRDPTFWRTLRDEVLPPLSDNRTIRVWHAGCSSGEEVFSMAVLLEEEGLMERANIYATDLHQSIIDQAKQGRFRMQNMETNRNNYEQFMGRGQLADHYEEKGDYAVFNPDLLRNVRFKVHDLVQDESFMRFDLILCRNVLIYFDQELQRKVVELFHQSNLREGYFCIGSKETIQWLNSTTAEKYKPVNSRESIYKKMRE